MESKTFKQEVEEAAIQHLSLAWLMWSIADHRGNEEGKRMNEYDMMLYKQAWKVIGLDVDKIEEEAYNLYKSNMEEGK